MDKLLDLIDSIKQLIPDQKYIELMAALSEATGHGNEDDDWKQFHDHLLEQEDHLHKHIPMACWDEDTPYRRLPYLLLMSIEHLGFQVEDLEKQVLWAVSKARHCEERNEKQALSRRWAEVTE